MPRDTDECEGRILFANAVGAQLKGEYNMRRTLLPKQVDHECIRTRPADAPTEKSEAASWSTGLELRLF